MIGGNMDDHTCFDLDRSIERIAASLQIAATRVRGTIELLDAGNTIPQEGGAEKPE